jgi:outer membrane protein, heavy metal efflux system
VDRVFSGIGLATLLAALSCPAWGQTAPTLDELIAIALEHAPSLPATRSRLDAARARVEPAAAFPDPSLELSGQAMGFAPLGPGSSLLLEYRQELPYPGKRAARQSAAEAEAGVRESEIEDATQRVVEEVRLAYAEVFALDRELRALASAGQLLASMEGAANARYAAGQGSQEAVLKVEIQAGRVRQRRAEVLAERTSAVAELDRLLGWPPDQALAEIPGLPPAPLPALHVESAREDDAPEVQVRRAAVTSALSRVDAARRDELPDFMLGGGGGIDGMAAPVVMLRFGVQLPIWQSSKQARLTEAEEHELRAAQAELEDARSRVGAEVARLRAEWVRADSAAGEYQRTILPGSRAAFEAALAGYVSGQGDFSMLLEDFNLALEAEGMLARAEAERFSAWARLQRLAPAELASGGRSAGARGAR